MEEDDEGEGEEGEPEESLSPDSKAALAAVAAAAQAGDGGGGDGASGGSSKKGRGFMGGIRQHAANKLRQLAESTAAHISRCGSSWLAWLTGWLGSEGCCGAQPCTAGGYPAESLSSGGSCCQRCLPLPCSPPCLPACCPAAFMLQDATAAELDLQPAGGHDVCLGAAATWQPPLLCFRHSATPGAHRAPRGGAVLGPRLLGMPWLHIAAAHQPSAATPHACLPACLHHLPALPAPPACHALLQLAGCLPSTASRPHCPTPALPQITAHCLPSSSCCSWRGASSSIATTLPESPPGWSSACGRPSSKTWCSQVGGLVAGCHE